MKIAVQRQFEGIADAKTNEIDAIMQHVEKYPLSWDYYKNQEVRFTPDFEILIIFYNKISTNRLIDDSTKAEIV